MGLANGSRLGPYEIVALLGAGGMGEVYSAHDTRLGRVVAVKVLPAEFTSDAKLKIRLEREAKAISTLNHPHICALYDVGPDYLVMEYCEGKTLAKRLGSGPLPIEQVLEYGNQIADALDKAHRAGIIHRDLKPANIMLTKSGVKLLDFGLAKQQADSSPDESTVQRMTEEGRLIGTMQYMAPELLAGEEADARSDIFALGLVLYEMVTGKPAFSAATKASLIAAILEHEPKPVTELQPASPLALEHIVSKCLAKDPEDRWQNAHDVAEEVRWISAAGSQPGTPVAAGLTRPHRQRLIAATALLLAIATGVLGILYRRANARAERVLIADLVAAPGTEFNDTGDYGGPPVLSPDGRYVVFSAVEPGACKLWLRNLATGETRALSGTELATFPFWSPDSRNVAFFGASNIKRVDISGGAPITLAPAAGARGGAWSKDGVIVYAPSPYATLVRIPENGGKPVEITKMNTTLHSTHRWPAFMPDGKHLLFLAANHQDPSAGSNGIYMVSIDGRDQRLIMNTLGNATYAAGYLLFVRDTTLYALKMSEEGKHSGNPWPVAAGVLNERGMWRGGFSASDSGDLLYCTGQAAATNSRAVWIDPSGKEIDTVADADMLWDVRLSPDQKKLALTIGNPSRQLWIADLVAKRRARIDLGARWVGMPAWTPDGSAVVVDVVTASGTAVLLKKLDGSPSRALFANDQREPGLGSTVSPDGKTVVYAAMGSLWRVPMNGSRAPTRLTPQAINASDPDWSPDGRWLAYTSNENGGKDIFIARRDFSQRWQVSETGGAQARWRADGRELYYIDNTANLRAVEISFRSDAPDVGESRPLFLIQAPSSITHAYDVSSDIQRLIMIKRRELAVPIKIVTNWTRLKTN